MSTQRTVPTQECSSGHSGRAERGQAGTPLPRYPNRLRAWIKQEGYTFREIAASTGVPESTLHDWAAGNRPIPHPMRYRLAHLFGCTIRELVPSSMMAATDHAEATMQQAAGLTLQETISPQGIALLMQRFGTLLQFLRLRSHVSQGDVLAVLALESSEVDQEQYSRLETGHPPRFRHLAAIYKALVRSGVEIRAEEREAYLLLARKRIESKVTHREDVPTEHWQHLSAELAAFDTGEPETERQKGVAYVR